MTSGIMIGGLSLEAWLGIIGVLGSILQARGIYIPILGDLFALLHGSKPILPVQPVQPVGPVQPVNPVGPVAPDQGGFLSKHPLLDDILTLALSQFLARNQQAK